MLLAGLDVHPASPWRETGLVFTTRQGTPVELRNFSRSFDSRIVRAKVRRITVHGTRNARHSVAALDVL